MQDVSIVMCGAAGQGIQTVEQLLVGIFKDAGYNVFATKEYESRVRGGSNSTELRVAKERRAALVDRMDIFIPFDQAAVSHEVHRISGDTLVIADKDSFPADGPADLPSPAVLLPFKEKALEVGNRLYTNVVAAGAVTGLFGVDPEIGEAIIRRKFSAKGEDLVRENIQALHAGNDLGSSLREKGHRFEVKCTKGVADELLLNGNQAIALGALAGGCDFISAYPMSPSTGVLEFLSQHQKDVPIVVDQAEDEIAAINKAVAAWFMGARAIVSTSGGGFDLMTEGLSMAGIMESPLVIHLAQRPGPATGLPTRTAQEDLNLAMYAGHGEFCRLVFAPGTITQAFDLTRKAFDIADRLQIPVFVLTDQDFVDSYYNIPDLDLSATPQDHFIETSEGYRRYELTEDGLSPRGVPGHGDGLVRLDSDEHDEHGHITEDLRHMRPAMVEKRLHHRRILMEEFLEPPTLQPGEAKNYVICWGSNHNVVKEAVELLDNKDLAMMHFHQVHPLHADVRELLSAAERTVLIENNATGQFADVLKLQADHHVPEADRHLRYSGRPWSVEEVVSVLRKEGF